MKRFDNRWKSFCAMALLGSAAALAPACAGEDDAGDGSVALAVRFHEPMGAGEEAGVFFSFADENGGRMGVGEFDDVGRIQVDVIDTATNQVVWNNFELIEGPENVWTGIVPFLPRNQQFRFFAEAFNTPPTGQSAVRLFSGQTEAQITVDNQAIEIPLSPEQDQDVFDVPRMVRIAYQDDITAGQQIPVVFTVEGNTGERITFEITAADGSQRFAPAAGGVTLAAPVADFVSLYTAPEVTTGTEFTYRILIQSDNGQSAVAVETEFHTRVVPRNDDAADNNRLRVLFNPVVLGLTSALQRGTDGAFFTADDSVELEAVVSDNGPQAALRYAWSFTPAQGTPAAGFASNGQGNPGILQNYQPTMQGRIRLAVTDGDNGTTTLFYDIVPDHFIDVIDDGGVSGITQMVSGDSHTCVLTTAGKVRCWGRAAEGQLGYGNTFNIGDVAARLPHTAGDVPLRPNDPVVQIAAGNNHTCALLQSGLAYCWGMNNAGQLGYGHTSNIGDGEPVVSAGFVNAGGVLSMIDAGGDHTCAVLKETGVVRCWGENQFGQLGQGTTTDFGDSSSEPIFAAPNVPLGTGTVKALALGDHHSCVIMTNGDVHCWGLNTSGQLGIGNFSGAIGDAANEAITNVRLGGPARKIVAGETHTCALMETGFMRCWGDDSNHQIGNAAHQSISDPSALGDIVTGDEVADIGLGDQHTCALLVDGQLKCWGRGVEGQLGNGGSNFVTTPPTTPVNLGAASAYLIGGGRFHTCAVRSNGKARCWGNSGFGQLGQGSTASILNPSATPDILLFAP
jgi:alpha-tubulin suppressor-like RCC1 family protein